MDTQTASRFLLFMVAGFILAQIFTDAGLRVYIGGFHFEHLYVGLIMMLVGWVMKKKDLRWLYLIYLGLGIAFHDFFFDYLL